LAPHTAETVVRIHASIDSQTESIV
jgi:hypothetical protein